MVGAMNLPFAEAIFWQSFSLISDFYNLSSDYLKMLMSYVEMWLTIDV